MIYGRARHTFAHMQTEGQVKLAGHRPTCRFPGQKAYAPMLSKRL